VCDRAEDGEVCRDNPCDGCGARCCRHIAIEIDRPESDSEFDIVRWYLLHRNVSVFVEAGRWYLQFETDCRYLDGDARCTIYATRPQTCRDHSPSECERHGELEYEVVLKSAEDLARYRAQLEPDAGRQAFRKGALSWGGGRL